MKRASGSDFSNMEWQARSFGYNDAVARPVEADIDSLVAAMPSVRFSVAQRGELLGSADYAYMMRLKHRAAAPQVDMHSRAVREQCNAILRSVGF